MVLSGVLFFAALLGRASNILPEMHNVTDNKAYVKSKVW
jgi:hypothetical protein